VSQRRLKLSQARSRSGVQVTSGTRVGGITGTGEVATITGGDLDLTPILTRTGGRSGGVARPMTTVGSVTTVASVGPVTTVASVGPVTTVASAGPVTTVGLMGPVVANSTVSAGDGQGGNSARHPPADIGPADTTDRETLGRRPFGTRRPMLTG
jgi:hypothetical protein